jgi:hypothetical protein
VTNREFRLLVLHSGQFDDALSATLVRSSLDDLRGLAYETVSYVWGDANLKVQLLVENAILEIPASASAVLRQVGAEESGFLLRSVAQFRVVNRIR